MTRMVIEVIKVPTVAAITELKARLSEFLDAVKGGGEVVITERGNPIARIVPLTGSDLQDPRLLELARSGAVRIGTMTIPDAFWSTEVPADPAGDSLSYLLQERTEGR